MKRESQTQATEKPESAQAEGGTPMETPLGRDSPPPLSPGRVTVNPDNEAGVDELPDNDGARPHADGNAELEPGEADIDVANAEMDGAPNPR